MKLRIYSCVISIVVIGFCVFIFSCKELEIRDKLMICISFLSLFATCIGAYLGAKISGDNTKELYKKQKKDEEEELCLKSEFILCKKISELEEKHGMLKHYAIYKKDENDFERDNKLEIDRVLDIYANILRDILKDNFVSNLDEITVKKAINILNDCNRYYNSFKDIDFEKIDKNKEKGIINVDSPYKLSGKESDKLLSLQFDWQSKDNFYETRYIVAYFIYNEMDYKLKDLLNSIKNKNLKYLFSEKILHSNYNEGFEAIYNLNY